MGEKENKELGCWWTKPSSLPLQGGRTVAYLAALAGVHSCQQAKGSICFPIFSICETTLGVMPPALGSAVGERQKDIEELERGQWRVTKMMKGLEHLVCEKHLTEWGLFNLKGKKLEIGVLLLPSTTCQVVTGKIVLETHSPITRGNRLTAAREKQQVA